MAMFSQIRQNLQFKPSFQKLGSQNTIVILIGPNA